jgi:hypothetical protein
MSGDDIVAQTGSDVIEKYETLRAAVLSEGLSLESRNGLALFLRRGMWGWIQAVTASVTPSRPPRPSYAKATIDEDEHRAVVHLFAAMATRSSNRRAHERIPQGPVASSRA